MKKTINTEEKRETIVDILKQLKAEDIMIMKMSDVTTIADYFILCSSDNTILSNAIIQLIYQKMKQYRIRPLFYPDSHESAWIVLDYGDVVLHIFHPEERKRYSLEDLWEDAPKTYISC